MKIVRVYTGDDGESHFEDLDVPLKQTRSGSLSDLVPATGIVFRETPVGGALDYHNAPQRQFVVNLSGEVEIECFDGTKRTLTAGGILLAEDTIGRGHITRDIAGPRYSIFVPIPADFDISAWR
jgi:hypothetical protein